MSTEFGAQVREQLQRAGWYVLQVPHGTTLAALREAGAPFKSNKYFQAQASGTQEAPVLWNEVAYRGALLPESLNRTYAEAAALVDELRGNLPGGAVPAIGPAALYVWLLVEHHRRHGEWLLQQRYTWAADTAGTAHLVVGVFGQQRPLMVSPVPEATGRGIGALPLIVPE